MSRILIILLTFLQFADPCCAHEPISEIAQQYILRPQEPLHPLSYDEEEVIFHNTLDNVTLAGTLTLPRSSGPFPVVILLH